MTVPLLALGHALMGGGMTVYSVTQISLRQAITPDGLLGRVNAGRRVLVFGVAPPGALLAGLLGESLGLRATLLVGAAVITAAWLVARWSPLRAARRPLGSADADAV